MVYSLKISKDQIIKDLKTLIDNHEISKVDQNPEYPDMMSKFESSMEIEDYFFFRRSDTTLLQLHEYDDGRFGFYFNHKNGKMDSYQPIVQTSKKSEVFNDQVINDIYKFLEDHINFMNSL